MGNQYGLEVVSIFQTAADSGCNGIYILQYGSIFNAGYVRIDRSLDVVTGQLPCEHLGFFNVFASYGEVRKPLQCHFFRMTGTCQYGYVVFWNVINLVEIIGYDKVFVGYDTLDSSNDEFILQFGF